MYTVRHNFLLKSVCVILSAARKQSKCYLKLKSGFHFRYILNVKWRRSRWRSWIYSVGYDKTSWIFVLSCFYWLFIPYCLLGSKNMHWEQTSTGKVNWKIFTILFGKFTIGFYNLCPWAKVNSLLWNLAKSPFNRVGKKWKIRDSSWVLG